MMERIGFPIVMVDLGPLKYLWEVYLKLGMAVRGEFGPEPWRWGEVIQFLDHFLPNFNSWELSTIMCMTRSYCDSVNSMNGAFDMSPLQIKLGDAWASLIPEDVKPGTLVTITIPQEV